MEQSAAEAVQATSRAEHAESKAAAARAEQLAWKQDMEDRSAAGPRRHTGKGSSAACAGFCACRCRWGVVHVECRDAVHRGPLLWPNIPLHADCRGPATHWNASLSSGLWPAHSLQRTSLPRVLLSRAAVTQAPTGPGWS